MCDYVVEAQGVLVTHEPEGVVQLSLVRIHQHHLQPHLPQYTAPS